MDNKSAPTTPPNPHKRWYVSVDGKVYGPYSGRDIEGMAQNGRILDTDHLCAEGGSTWIEARNEPMFATLFSGRSGGGQVRPQRQITDKARGTQSLIANNQRDLKEPPPPGPQEKRLIYLYGLFGGIGLSVLTYIFLSPATRRQFDFWLVMFIGVIMVIGTVGPKIQKLLSKRQQISTNDN
jgi:hypothetical protein